MQRLLLTSGSRTCLRCSLDLSSKTTKRSFGKQRHRAKLQRPIDGKSREERIKRAGEDALLTRYERNEYNRKYLKQKKKTQVARKDRDEEKNIQRGYQLTKKAERARVKEAWKAVKEDWKLGPLAPRRDIGEMAERFGMLEAGFQRQPRLTEHMKKQMKEKITKNKLLKGDRVVLLKGNDKGKIGVIQDIDEDAMAATVEGLNKVAIHLPSHMLEEEADDTNYRVVTRDIPLDQLRLVHSMRDPKDPDGKVIKEVILEYMDIGQVLKDAPGKTAKVEAGPYDQPLYCDDGTILDRETEEPYTLEGYQWVERRFLPGTIQDGTRIMISDYFSPEEEEAKKFDHYDDKRVGPDDVVADDVRSVTYDFSVYEDPLSWDESLFTLGYSESSEEKPREPALGILRDLEILRRKTRPMYPEHVEESIRRKAEEKERRLVELEDKVRTPLMDLREKLKKIEWEAVAERRRAFAAGRVVEANEDEASLEAAAEYEEVYEDELIDEDEELEEDDEEDDELSHLSAASHDQPYRSRGQRKRWEKKMKGKPKPPQLPEGAISDVMVQLGMAMERVALAKEAKSNFVSAELLRAGNGKPGGEARA